MLLLSVNLGGVSRSLQQILLKRRAAFGRTPKVASRTAIPCLYLFASYSFLIFCLARFAITLHSGHWLQATYIGSTGLLLAYGIGRFIGLRETWKDLVLGYRSLVQPGRAKSAQKGQKMYPEHQGSRV